MNDDDENEVRLGNNNNGSANIDTSANVCANSYEFTEETFGWRSVFDNFIKCCKCGSQSQSSQNNSDEEGGNKVNPFIKGLAIAFSRRPLVVLFITILIAFTITWIGLSEYGLPEFDDPYLGFETRSTSISNRMITLSNLKNEINQLQVLENYPGEKLSGREWRRRRRRQDDHTFSESDDENDIFEFNNRDLCTQSPLEDFSRIALELKNPKDIFDYETVMLMCFFQKKVEDLHSYKILCEKDAIYECCPGWSLPNYIAQYRNKSDCAQLRRVDITVFMQDLMVCQNWYRNETAKQRVENTAECWKRDSTLCPKSCLHGSILHSTFTFSLDNSFLLKNESRFSMLVLPIGKTSNDQLLIEYLQDELPNIILPKDYVHLAGYDFGGKDTTFKSYLVSDLQYMMTASIIIFAVVCFYTKSIFVTFISFGILTLSMGNAYFFYSAVLKVPYFPFMNMLVTIIVMGIGTDGTLILGAQWHRLKKKYTTQQGEKLYWETMMIDLLSETTSPLFITTCTTAIAFFASLTSSITTIRCFSIFAGTSTLFGFVLLYFSVPPALILSDMTINYLSSLLPHESESKGKIFTRFLQFYENIANFLRASMNVFTKPYDCIKKFTETHRAKCWLSVFLVLVAILMWSTYVVFIHPTFELPNTEQFQLLSSNHPIERFDRVVEPEFTIAGLSEEDLGDKMTVYYVWGLQSIDTGNTLDPMDNGVLSFDNTFSMDHPSNQKWMRKLCSKLKQQPFYDEVTNSMVGAHYDSCFIETMVKWMKRDCEHIFFKNVSYAPCCKMSKFPYDADVFSKCVGLASRDMHRTPSTYFRTDVAGPKFLVLMENEKKDKTNKTILANSTASSSTVGGSLATFSLRVKTNVTFSLAYEKMDKFYNQLETFFNEYLQSENAPQGLENGFFISAHFDFYDLQKSLLNDTFQSVLLSAGLCFLFLWIFIRKLRVAIGAVICIFSIVIVSSAILITAFSWKLGVFESIAVTVAIGLSDFTAHNSIEFSKRKSVAAMTSPTFFAAVTTITMGLMMLTCSNVLVYQQIGAFFFVLILVSWIYSVFFLSPVLALFDYILTVITLRRVPKPPSAIFTTGVSYPSTITDQLNNDHLPMDGTVYSNTMLTNHVNRRSKSSLHKNRAISEPAMQHARNSVHFGRAESTELVESPIRRGDYTRSSHNMVEQWKLLKKLGTETAV